MTNKCNHHHRQSLHVVPLLRVWSDTGVTHDSTRLSCLLDEDWKFEWQAHNYTLGDQLGSCSGYIKETFLASGEYVS